MCATGKLPGMTLPSLKDLILHPSNLIWLTLFLCIMGGLWLVFGVVGYSEKIMKYFAR